MDFSLTQEQQAIGEAVSQICASFPSSYWRERDSDGVFPHEFHRAMAEGGWLGITMPEDLGGAGLGLIEAALMMNAVARGGGAMTAVSSIHINLFGPHPIVLFGTEEQKIRWLKPLIAGTDKTAFGVTEPNAGLDTTNIETFAEKVDGGYKINGRKIWTSTGQVANKILLLTRTTKRDECERKTQGMTLFYTDLDRSEIDVRRIDKMGRKAVDSNEVFIDDLFVPDEDLLGDEGKGFSYLLHSLNPERVLIGIEAVGIGQCALGRATQYARERVVFSRPIGQNQAIQHPLAANWASLEAAYTMCLKTAWMYDSGVPCGAEANASKMLGAQAGYDTCLQAVLTHGGMGYAKEFDVERYLREVLIARIAPVSEQLILSYIAENALDLPKSY
jgi:acyl-CoA dehydrogenase